MSSISIAICGVLEVPAFAQSQITDIVSIGDVEMWLPDLSRFSPVPKLHRFEFNDICHVADVSPTQEHIKNLLTLFDTFLARTEDSRILFHCTAGRSRSTAAAFIFYVRAGISYSEAYRSVEQARGAIAPNILMVKYADILMNQGGKMLEHAASYRPDAQEWVKNNPIMT